MSNAIDVTPPSGQAREMIIRLTLLLAFFSASVAFASEFPSEWRFVTLKTAHFDVIVNAQQQELGRLYATKLEQSYALLKAVFTDAPERTAVVIADKTDLTNGYATRLPYSHIFIYPVLSGPQESLSEAGDWALELTAHEYTHVLTFDAVSGFPEALQSIFGTILSPNLLLPTWWKEGVAVQSETYFSNGGRLRSAYQDGVIRAMETEGSIDRYSIAEVNEMLPDWPQGMRPYLFGALFWQDVVAKKGIIAVDELHQRHGGRMPYFLNGPAEDILGLDYAGFYQNALTETDLRARQQIRALSALPPTITTEMRFDSRTTLGPQISPDGNYLALISVDERARRSIRVFARNPQSKTFVDGTEIEKFVSRRESDVQPPLKDGPPTGTISRLSWMPDGKRIVFDKVDNVSRFETWSDLWIFDIESGESKRLSTALRAREPFAAKDGKTIFFTGLDGGRTFLGRYDIEKNEARKIWSAPLQDRIAFPAELADGRLVFSRRTSAGQESLMIISASGGEPQPILTDYPNARMPSPVGNGFLFTSSKNGVHNAYVTDGAMTSARALTHSTTAIFTTITDPQTKDFYATTMTAHGPFVRHIAAAEAERISSMKTLPSVGPLFGDRYPKKDAPATPPEPAMTTEDYNPGPYLWPRYWLPFVALSAVNDSVVMQAATSGFDPLKKHVYSIAGEYDFGLKRGSHSLSYLNGVFDTSVLFTSARYTTYLVSKDFPVVNDSASVTLVPDVFRISRYLSVNVGWQMARTDFSSTVAERSGPVLIGQYVNFGRTGEQISPEEGGSALLGVVDQLPGENRLEYVQYMGAAQFFYSGFLPKRHAIALRASASYIPQSIGAIYGSQTTNFFRLQDEPGLQFVARGYRVGHFFGKSLGTVNAEYRFPISEIRRGHGTTPFYILRLFGNVFADAVAVDGFAYKPDADAFDLVSTDHPFASAGAELHLETTVGYFLPITVIAGFAAPSDRAHSDGPTGLFSIQMGTLF